MKREQKGEDFWTVTDEQTGRLLGVHWYHYPGFDESFNVTGLDYEMTKHQTFEEAVATAEAWLSKAD